MSRSRALTRQLTFSAEGFPVKTSPAPANGVESAVPVPASGTTSPRSSGKSGRASSSSKTSRVANPDGSRRSAKLSDDLDIERAPWGLPPQTWEPRTFGDASSLLPTLSATSYGSNKGGAACRHGRARPSLDAMARAGAIFPTLTAKQNMLAPSMQKWPSHRRMMPTLTARYQKGPGPTHTKAGADLPQVLGGHLSPTFCEWLMGYPEDWTRLEPESKPSATPSSRNARKSSGSSSSK